MNDGAANTINNDLRRNHFGAPGPNTPRNGPIWTKIGMLALTHRPGGHGTPPGARKPRNEENRLAKNRVVPK